jgi:hypothetical protein
MRVQHPTKHEYKKLSRVIKYLRHTKDLVLRLSAENLYIIKCWTDASYGVHHDMRSHTGGVMLMGTGAAYSTSRKQKLNTKGSTKAELVAVDNVLPQALWTKCIPSSTRTTKIPLSCLRTAKLQTERVPGTSISGISSSLIVLPANRDTILPDQRNGHGLLYQTAPR